MSEYKLTHEDGRWWLRHPRWSLLGVGETPALAGHDLQKEACELLVAYADFGEGELSEEAKNMLRFAKRSATSGCRPLISDGDSATYLLGDLS